MNQRVDLRRLYWKEVRQLGPLVGLLLGMGVALHGLFLMVSTYGLGFRQGLLLFGLPCLFAVGASALLVGQERESRTLQWLSALPVPTQDIIRIKLLVSLLGLLVVWLGSGLLYFLARSIHHDYTTSVTPFDSGAEFMWLLHSAYLLVLGFATAWRMRSALMSLLVLVPLACLPHILSSLSFGFLGQQDLAQAFLRHTPSSGITALWLAVFSVGAFLYGLRSARLALAPAPSHAQPRFVTEFDQWWHRNQVTSPRPIASPLSALIWQFTAQNRLTLAGILALCLLAACLLISAGDTAHFLSAIAAIQVAVATLWLGLLVFQSDQLQQRVRFLAVHGVSPAAIWLTRQMIPCGMLTVIFVGCSWLTYYYQPQPIRSLPIGSATLALLFAIFGVAQWIGQLVKSPIVATLLAPLACVLSIGLALSANNLLATPLSVLVLCSLIPFLATFCTMRPFMDGRTGLTYWLQHMAWFGISLVLLLSPLLVDLWQQPRLAPGLAAQFRSEVEQLSSYRVRPTEIVLTDRVSPPVPTEPTLTTEESEGTTAAPSAPPEALSVDASLEPLAKPTSPRDLRSPNQKRSDWLHKIEQQLAQHSGPIQYSRAILFVRGDMLLARFQLEQTSKERQELDRYRQDAELLLVIIQRLRLSPRLIEQEFADALEIELLHELQLPQARLWLGDEFFKTAAEWLSNSKSRHEARRRAVLLSWSELQAAKTKDIPSDNLLLPAGQFQPNWLQLSFRNRQASYMAGQLMEYLNATQPEQRQSLIEELANYWKVPASCYVNPLEPQTSSFVADEPLIDLLGNTWIPARYWHGTWETQAAELLKGMP